MRAPQVTDLLEHRVLNVGIGHELFHKMVRELAVLGFLSFSSSVLLQFVILPEETVQLFEYAHTVMCAPRPRSIDRTLGDAAPFAATLLGAGVLLDPRMLMLRAPANGA